MTYAKLITQQRKQAIKNLLPDLCQLVPATGTGKTIDGAGISHQTAPTPRLWRGSANHPCRADLSRAFRPDKLKVQTTEVNEFNLELPYDAIVNANDTVILRNRHFVIRKIKDASNWDVTIECVIEEISTVLDNS